MWQPSLSVQASGESVSKGALLGLSTQHSKADWYRALVEGLLFALKRWSSSRRATYQTTN
jgi:sugar (pentulose or hexulose) kinase